MLKYKTNNEYQNSEHLVLEYLHNKLYVSVSELIVYGKLKIGNEYNSSKGDYKIQGFI